MSKQNSSDSYQLVVFDVAGTTVFEGDAVVECLTEALRAHIDVSRDDARQVMGLPKPVAIRKLLEERGPWRDEQLAALTDDVHSGFRRAIINRYRTDDSIAPAPGAIETFAALHRAGIYVALDTGFSRDILDALLARLYWRRNGPIDVSVSSDEVARGRPFPDLIEQAMLMTGVTDAGRVVKVGDTPADLEQGLAARCGLVVGVTHGTHTRAQLARPGTIIIDRLPELLPFVAAAAS